MPSQSGLSHALLAIFVMLTGEVLRWSIKLVIGTDQIRGAIHFLANLVTIYWEIPYGFDLITNALTIGIIGVFAFLWGYGYHLKRHEN